LFEEPRYDVQENAIVSHLMNYMCEEFLKSGIGIVYDSNALRVYQRRQLRELARQHKADYFLIWLQIDADSAYSRTQNRDRRTNDDKFSEPQTHSTFEKQAAGMQNPQGEDYLVISGKHTFATQKSAILNRFYQLGIIGSGAVQNSVAKPGLINLVPYPHTGRVDMSRRNISIR